MRLLLGLRPEAAKHLELGAMDAADAGVAAHGLASHPAFPLVRPLPRPLQVPDVPTSGDRVAVDIARHAEVELTRRGRRRSLVDECETDLPVPGEDLGHALEAHRHELGIEVVVFSSQLYGSIRELDPFADARCHQCAERMEDSESRVQRGLRLGFEQTLGSRQPSGADRSRLAAERLIREQHRHPRGLAGPAGISLGGEGSFQCLGGLVRATCPPGGRAEGLKVRGRELAVAIGRDERLHRLRPRVSVHGVATLLDCLDHPGRTC